MTIQPPRIALTVGEPAGIGPDLCVLLAQQPRTTNVVVIGDADVLSRRAEQLGLPLSLEPFDPAGGASGGQPAGCLTILEVPTATDVQCGQLNPRNARHVLGILDRTITGCLNNVFQAMVTGPVHKGLINDAGYKFSGHTEYIARHTGGSPVMMLATSELRVALATTHIPLAAVSQAITRASLERVLGILHAGLRQRFGIREPRISVCALNPHAGEGGHLGREEIEIIEPVLQRLRRSGWQLSGPLPADTAFTPRYLGGTDAVLAMYHDQGLPVLKYAGFGQAVNVTLGLPIVRTSVDHGTALDIAGTGNASCTSLLAALQMASQMAARVEHPVTQPGTT